MSPGIIGLPGIKMAGMIAGDTSLISGKAVALKLPAAPPKLKRNWHDAAAIHGSGGSNTLENVAFHFVSRCSVLILATTDLFDTGRDRLHRGPRTHANSAADQACSIGGFFNGRHCVMCRDWFCVFIRANTEALARLFTHLHGPAR
jgi:hypothetical protein